MDMLNYIAIDSDTIIFAMRDELKRIRRTNMMMSLLHKKLMSHQKLLDVEEELYDLIKDQIPLDEDYFLDGELQEQIQGLYPVIYSVFDVKKVMRAYDTRPEGVLPILFENDMIYIGPLTRDKTVFKEYINRLASNDKAIQKKLELSGTTSEQVLFNMDFILDQMKHIQRAAKELVEDGYENEVWILCQGKLQRHAFQILSKKSKQRGGDIIAAVDNQLGLINDIRVEDIREYGVDVHIAVSSTCDFSRYNSNMFAQSNSGAGFDATSATYSAVGESLERFAGGIYHPQVIQMGTAKEVGSHIDLSKFILFSKEQYEEKGFPYHPLQESTRICWTKAENLVHGGEDWVPLAFTQLPYRAQEGEIRISPAISTGLALGPTREQAILSGIYEVLERDAFASSWLLKLAPNRELRVEDYMDTSKIITDTRYAIRAYDISVQDLLHTVMVTIHDTGNEHVMVGAATRFTTREAIRKAFIEAAQGITYINMLVRMYEKEGLMEDFNRIDSFQKHAAFYSIYPKMQKKVGYVLDPDYRFVPRENSNFPETEGLAPSEQLAAVLDRLEKQQKDVYYVNMDFPGLSNLHASAARIIIPGLQPLHGAHKYRFLDDRRLREIAGTGVLNPYPHPFP